MRVRCACGREAVLTRPGKRKNCRHCGANLREAKPVRPRTIQLKPGRTPKPKTPKPDEGDQTPAPETDANDNDDQNNERIQQ